MKPITKEQIESLSKKARFAFNLLNVRKKAREELKCYAIVISREELANMLDVTDTAARNFIGEIRDAGIVVVGSKHGGYYLPINEQEENLYLNQTYRQAFKLLKRAGIAKKIRDYIEEQITLTDLIPDPEIK